MSEDRNFGAKIERDAMPVRGARFYREGDVLMFSFVIDRGNIIGPRPATEADSKKHPEAWSAFVGAQADQPHEPKRRRRA